MAKLSARGRTIVVSVTRERTADTLQRLHDRAFPAGDAFHGPALTTYERSTRRVMSDGTVLEKRDVIFRQSEHEREPQRHTYTWKVHGKLKPGVTAADFTRIYLADRKDGSPSVWKLESDRTPAARISMARLMRAVQADDSIGFCTSCGAEASGVEPDARGYRCESCGQSAVYGAEELLSQTA